MRCDACYRAGVRRTSDRCRALDRYARLRCSTAVAKVSNAMVIEAASAGRAANDMEGKAMKGRAGVFLLWLLAGILPVSAAQAQVLPALRIDPTQVTVSGISSGAYMAVQFGVAHAEVVSGVAATAGGPYFCAGGDALGGAAVGRVIARCMQGDPAYPARPIGVDERRAIAAATRQWAEEGRIAPLSALAAQRVWLFHGYNDGIVRRAVVDALFDWYREFVPGQQVFYRNDMNAAHAQISATCTRPAATDGGAACNACTQTGGQYINACIDPLSASAYDAAGAALQLFHGPLLPPVDAAGAGTVQAFDQRPYVRRGERERSPVRVALADTGYLYLPAPCAAGEPCRLHVAFHGCQQQAERIGLAFVNGAGFNEWAAANRIVVLYPQTVATRAVPFTPYNPQGCWDWWGYNDFFFDFAGRYATREGVQVAAVWRMVQRLMSGGEGRVEAAPASVPELLRVDVSARAVALSWVPAAGAVAYRLLRHDDEAGGAAVETIVNAPPFVDHGVLPARSYRYRLQALAADGAAGEESAELVLRTASEAPPCDPYYSLAADRPVDARNRPSAAVCP